MSNLAIQVENLSKQYKIGMARYRHDSIRDHLAEWAKSLFVRNGHPVAAGGLSSSVDGPRSSGDGSPDTIWALKDVSFEIKRGEVVGIIGRNGAGKSTLLKILSRIVEPTGGFAEIHGRVGSLLEVGTGFHRDLTGRENIYLNGAILGMRKSEIDKKFDEIVDFSGIEKFIDTPVKRYSSGMYVRLAFAVAANLDPEILIIDEVLAVGDAAFQIKCLGKMHSVAQESRTVLFVSHNMQAVGSLCSRAILIDGGRIEQSGDTATVIKAYLESSMEDAVEQLEQVWNDIDAAAGNDKVRLRRISIRPDLDGSDRLIGIATPFRIEVEYRVMATQKPFLVKFNLRNLQNLTVFETRNISDPNWRERVFPPGLYRSTCYVPGHLLNDNSYEIGLQFFGTSGSLLYQKLQAAMFTVHDLEPRLIRRYGKIGGIIRPNLKWETTLLSGGG
jgi:homopolymeric O-antigen transport system ATP-binding protein